MTENLTKVAHETGLYFVIVLVGINAYTSSTDVYWRILDTNWWAHLGQCHRNPDTLKGPGTMLNQSRDPPHIWGSANLCKLNYRQNSGEL